MAKKNNKKANIDKALDNGKTKKKEKEISQNPEPEEQQEEQAQSVVAGKKRKRENFDNEEHAPPQSPQKKANTSNFIDMSSEESKIGEGKAQSVTRML